MVLHAFAMGIATVFFENATRALFLARFGDASALFLPYVYIGAAVVTTLTGLAYTRLERRLSFGRLMGWTLGLLLALVLAAMAGLSLSQAAAVLFALFILDRLLSMLTDLEYWAVASHLFDVRQSKRLFSLIGSGEVIARILGGLAIPWVVGFVGVPRLLGVSAAGLAACLVLLLLILHLFSRELRPRPASAEEKEPRGEAAPRPLGLMRTLLRDRYLRLLFALVALGILGKYFVDYAFLEQSQSRYGSAEQLAGFFGYFGAASQVVNLLVRLLLSGRFLNRFGIRAGLLVLPAAHFLLTLGILAAGLVARAPALVFWFIVANQGVYKTLKHPIDSPAFKVLYQPLKRDRRLAAQIAVEIVMTPITVGLAGGVMLLASVAVPYEPTRFAWVLLLTFAGWIAVVLPVSRAYAQALLQALRRHTAAGARWLLGDEATRTLLRKKLGARRPEEVLFAAEQLEQADPVEMEPLWAWLAGHPSARVRRFAITRIGERRSILLADRVEETLADEREPAVRAACLTTLGRLGAPGSLERLCRHVGDGDRTVAAGALVGLLHHPDGAGMVAVARPLAALATAPGAADRELAARVIGEGPPGRLGELLGRLLKDREPQVRRSALAAAGRVYESTLWPRLLDNLKRPAFSSTATAALVAAGEATLPDLGRALDDAHLPWHLSVRLARICGRIGGDRAVGILRGLIDHPDRRVRLQGLSSLSRCAFRASAGDREGLLQVVRSEVEDAAHHLATIADLGSEEATAPLRSALDWEIHQGCQRIFLLLAFLYDPKIVLSARDGCNHASRRRRAYAVELLDVALPGEITAFLLPLIDDLPVEERLAALGLPRQRLGRDARLIELISGRGAKLNAWTLACALHASPRLLAAGADPEPPRLLLETILREGTRGALVRETAAWALDRLGGRGAGGAPIGGGNTVTMLTIEKVMILKGVSIFSRTAEQTLAEVAAILEEVDCPGGKAIFHEGDVGSSMYIVIEGRVRVHRGETVLAELGEREIFGELAVLDPEPRSASVTALEDTRVFRLDRDAFFELIADHVEVAEGVFEVLCQRLRETSARQVRPGLPGVMPGPAPAGLGADRARPTQEGINP